MNDIIQTIQRHRSIRAFTDEPIRADQFQQIIASGMAGSTSHFMQVLSVIRVTDMEKRQKLAALAGNQAYVASAAEFLVFCIDFHRHYELNPDVKPEFMELTLVGAVDAGIMAQNCLLAAESMGLGGVFIGGLRNHPAEVAANRKHHHRPSALEPVFPREQDAGWFTFDSFLWSLHPPHEHGGE